MSIMKRIAVYAGSFDPPTLGHLDIVRKVSVVFDAVVCLVADNSRKSALFTAVERQQMLRDSFRELGLPDHVTADAHDGLVVDYCRKHGARVLVRGLRAVSDFETEFQIAAMNRRLAPEIETFLVMANESHHFVSSSLVKEVARHGAPMAGLVPNCVASKLKEKAK